jgi:hypothetical protein
LGLEGAELDTDDTGTLDVSASVAAAMMTGEERKPNPELAFATTSGAGSSLSVAAAFAVLLDMNPNIDMLVSWTTLAGIGNAV